MKQQVKELHMRSKIVGVLTAVALLSVVVAGIGSANAYFTTYTQAAGQRVIRLGDKTTVAEEFDSWQKEITVTNSKDSPMPVYVRAKAFAGSEYKLTCSGTNWVQGDGDYWYYEGDSEDEGVVQPGASTKTPLVVNIADKDGNEIAAAEEGKSFNVVIVYETTPAVEDGFETDADGKATGKVSYKEADWDLNVTTTTEGGTD